MASEKGPGIRYVASVIAAYWFLSISMVYTNKVLMTNRHLFIPAPLFVTWTQCMVTSALCWLCGYWGRLQRRQSSSNSSKGGGGTSVWIELPDIKPYDMATAVKILPLSCIFVGMMATNNICLKHVEVSFYNIARSFTILFNVILSHVILGQPTPSSAFLPLLLIVLGFLAGIEGELNFSYIGTVSGVFSSLFLSLNAIYTKATLPTVGHDHWFLTYINSTNAALLFLPFVLIFETPTILDQGHLLLTPTLYLGLAFSGILSFAVCLITVMQIQVTNPLAHNVSGTAKAAVQSLLAYRLWGNRATAKSLLGIALILLGSSGYAYTAMVGEMRRRKSEGKGKKAAAPTSAGELKKDR